MSILSFLLSQKNIYLQKINNEGETGFRFLIREKDGVEKKVNFSGHGVLLFSTDSCFYLSYPYCDTIYSISSDLSKITPSYYIDYTPKKLPDIPIEPTDDVISWEKKLSHLDDYSKTSSIGVGDDFLYIGITDKAYKGYLSLYSKRSKK